MNIGSYLEEFQGELQAIPIEKLEMPLANDKPKQPQDRLQARRRLCKLEGGFHNHPDMK